jgi:hypothetical protein
MPAEAVKLVFDDGKWHPEGLPECEERKGLWIDSEIHVFLLTKCNGHYSLYVGEATGDETPLTPMGAKVEKSHNPGMINISFNYHEKPVALEAPVGEYNPMNFPRLRSEDGEISDILTDFE